MSESGWENEKSLTKGPRLISHHTLDYKDKIYSIKLKNYFENGKQYIIISTSKGMYWKSMIFRF